MTASEKLKKLGIELPSVARPLASYVPAERVGDQVWVSGQLPLVNGELPATGKVGFDVSAEEAKELAQKAALNALAAIDAEAGLDNITRVLKITGFVASDVNFTEQPAVINGASDFIGEVFGEAGTHVRSAVGVAVLPKNSPVEIELVVEVAH